MPLPPEVLRASRKILHNFPDCCQQIHLNLNLNYILKNVDICLTSLRKKRSANMLVLKISLLYALIGSLDFAVHRKREGIFSLSRVYVNNFPFSSGWGTARGYTPDISLKNLTFIKSFLRYSNTFKELQDSRDNFAS